MRKGLPSPQNAQFGGGSGGDFLYGSPRSLKSTPRSLKSTTSAVSYNSSAGGRPRKIKTSQLAVEQDNAFSADEVRQTAALYSAFDGERREFFMGKQQQRIRAYQKQRSDVTKSVER